MPVVLKPFGSVDWEKKAFQGTAEVRGAPPGVEAMSEDELADALKEGVDVLIADIFVKVTGKAIEGARNLRGIACRSIGIDYLDVRAANRAGVIVTNIRDYCVVAVAEYTMGIILTLFRHIPAAAEAVRRGQWARRYEFAGTELEGKTIGLIGLGNIGQRVATYAKAFGMRVLAYSPHVRKEVAAAVGAKLVSLDELLREADIVSVHTSLRDDNRGLLNEDRLRAMKLGSYLVNVSRGALVDEDALYRVLRDGHLAGAALDVLCAEPPREDNPLLTLDNVIITPHIAWNTGEAKKKAESTIVEQVSAMLAGKVPKHVVNPEVIPVWQRRWSRIA